MRDDSVLLDVSSIQLPDKVPPVVADCGVVALIDKVKILGMLALFFQGPERRMKETAIPQGHSVSDRDENQGYRT